MFQFPRLPPPDLCVRSGVTAHYRRRVAPFGNPGISLLDGSSWLIAVIPRPSSARSAKASTVRRSHLTCATPRACTPDREPVPEVVALLEAPGQLPGLDRIAQLRAALFQRSHLCMSSEPHTYLPRPSGCASSQPSREFPAAPLMSWESALSPPPGGMLWTHLNHYVPCKGASRGRSPRG